jgi:Acetyltransferase (GNAT) family
MKGHADVLSSGCCSFCLKSLIILFLWMCLCSPRVWRRTEPHCFNVQLYADALIPVNNDGLGDYVRNAMSSSAFQPWLRQNPQPSDIASKTNTKTVIRIKRTEESQLSDIASFLATSSQQSCMQERQKSNPWKDRIDLLFAKSDIEALIRRRWRILQIGRRASTVTKKQLEQQQQQEANVRINHGQRIRPQKKMIHIDDDVILQYLWSTNDELRTEIQLAASETGEDTIWKHHYPMIITPSSKEWFNHIQISATAASIPNSPDTAKSTETASAFKFPFTFKKELKNDSITKVVGFCEVAMLSNPIYFTNQTVDECSYPIKNDCVISIQDRTQQHVAGTAPQFNYYSPAIANLAVDHTMRRQGIATKLLQRAERYISRYWTNTTTIGLYVSTSNTPAIRLYEKCGYQKQMTVSSTSSSSSDFHATDRLPDNAGTMWYMSKKI